MIIVDTSGLLAIKGEDQRAHSAVVDAVLREAGPFVLSPFVLAEADYMLLTRSGFDAEREFLQEVTDGAYELVGFGPDDMEKAVEIVEKYRDTAIGLADASLVVLAARYGTTRILTLDHRHFRALRPIHAAPAFELVP